MLELKDFSIIQIQQQNSKTRLQEEIKHMTLKTIKVQIWENRQV